MNSGKFLKIIHWTVHSKMKMRQYGLSKTRVLRVLSQPKRVEKGIVPKTIAVMQPASRKKEFGEIWLMYQDKKSIRTIITAWRYPGKSPVGETIPIPEDIKRFLKNYNNYEY